ncbi:MAG TPA: hypothetical protein VMV72_09715 [Verrucomicrobiae bacterium]|nr:hypothetical protein [Verrucomicrobiae bacterium]
MKKCIVLAVAAMVTMAAAVYADGGCCAGMSKTGASCSGDMFSKLNLTPDQKAKVTTLLADCHKATSQSEFHAMFNSGMEKILTPDQLAQWKSMSDKAAKSGTCPFMNSSGAKTDKT